MSKMAVEKGNWSTNLLWGSVHISLSLFQCISVWLCDWKASIKWLKKGDVCMWSHFWNIWDRSKRNSRKQRCHVSRVNCLLATDENRLHTNHLATKIKSGHMKEHKNHLTLFRIKIPFTYESVKLAVSRMIRELRSIFIDFVFLNTQECSTVSIL